MTEGEWIRLAFAAWGFGCLGLLLGALLNASGRMSDEERAQETADRIVEQGRRDARYGGHRPTRSMGDSEPPQGSGVPRRWTDENGRGTWT